MLSVPRTSQVSQLLVQMRSGDSAAHERLIAYLANRLQRLARAMLSRDRVRHLEQPSDLLQDALLRLHRSVERSGVVHVQGLLGLAAREMRFALVDMARHYFGPQGIATHQGRNSDLDRAEVPRRILVCVDECPSKQMADKEFWQRFYEEIDALPEQERQVVDLIWICGLTQIETATALQIDRTTVVRRWRRARLKLHDALADTVPEL